MLISRTALFRGFRFPKLSRSIVSRAMKYDQRIQQYLKRTEELNSSPDEIKSLYTLKCEQSIVGFLREETIPTLDQYPEVFCVQSQERNVNIHSNLKTPQQRTDAVATVLEDLRAKYLIQGWRNEAYPVSSQWDEDHYFVMERAAVPMFGVKAYGVHVNGYVIKGDEMFMWVAKRSPTKQTWPSKLDHIVAGGQPFGIGLMENVIKECEEEADIPFSLAQKAKPAGVVSYAKLRSDGIKRDVLFVYDLLLPEDFTPSPKDGEVESFFLLHISKVDEIIRTTTEYKPNCAIVIIDFLIRHGFISPDQSGYLELLASLRSGKGFKDPFRHLGDRLAGVIFGCSDETLGECIDEGVFGLPIGHQCYVERIKIGMPLFLFNYTRRELHGVFLAASNGEMDIRPSAWTKEASERTPFPSQVRIKVHKKGKVLKECEFKPAIIGNYNCPSLFQFELDEHQVKQLCKLYKSSVPKMVMPSETAVEAKSEVGKRRPLEDKLCHLESKNVCSDPKDMSDQKGSVWAYGEDHHFDSDKIKASSSTPFSSENMQREETTRSGCLLDGLLRKRNFGFVSETTFVIPWNSNSCLPNLTMAQPFQRVPPVEEIPLSGSHLQSSLQTTTNEPYGLQPTFEFASYEPDKLQKLSDPVCKPDGVKPPPGFENISPLGFEIPSLEDVAGPSSVYVSKVDLESDLDSSSEVSEIDDYLMQYLLFDNPEEVFTLNSEGDTLVLLGGVDNEKAFSRMEILQEDQSTWKTSILVPSLDRVNGHLVTNGGSIFLLGGGSQLYAPLRSVDVLHIGRNRWESVAPIPHRHPFFTAVSTKTDIFLAGGGTAFIEESECHIYHIETDLWTTGPNLETPRMDSASCVQDSVIYVTGGEKARQTLNSIEMLDPRMPQWISLPPMSKKRRNHRCISYEDRLWVLGGIEDDHVLPSVETYDMRNQIWSEMPSLSWSRAFFTAEVLQNELHVLGGCAMLRNESYLYGERFDSESQSWIEGLSIGISGKRGHHGSCALRL